jgi:hypothetical protein
MIHLKVVISSILIPVSLLLIIVSLMFFFSPIFGAPLVYTLYGVFIYIASYLIRRFTMTPNEINDYIKKYSNDDKKGSD